MRQPLDHVELTSPPETLAPLHPLLARSTYALALTALTTCAAAFDIDILARFGTDEIKLLAAVDAMLPFASAVWLWLERYNPSRRIGF